MEGNNNEMVYTTPYGKKYHLHPHCSYIKGKPINQIPINIAKRKFEGPCSRCLVYQDYKLNKNNQFYFNNKKNFNFNHKFFQNKNQNFNQINNIKTLNSENLNKKNEEEENKKINDKSDDQKDILSDGLVLSCSGSVLAGGGFYFRKKIDSEENSSEIDFNNNKFTSKNKKYPFPINNNISGINNFEISSEMDNYDCLLNKNFNSKNKEEEEDNKNILKSILEESEDYKNKEILLNNNSINNKKKLIIENEKIDENSKEFNIINNQNYKNNESSNLYKRDENAFFSSIEDINDSNIIKKEENKSIQNINISKKYVFSNSDFLLNNKLKAKTKRKKKCNTNQIDLKLLEDTNINATILSIEKNILKSNNTITTISNTLNNENFIIKNNNKNYSYNYNIKNYNDEIKDGSFKYSFEIIPKIQNKVCVKIEVGFEINFIDENDEDIIDDDEENNESISDDNETVLNSIIQKFSVLRQFKIYKQTNQIFALINVEKGKFFVIGEKELNSTNNQDNLSFDENNILYTCKSQMISVKQIKEVKPIFNYNKKDMDIVEIIFNGKKILE